MIKIHPLSDVQSKNIGNGTMIWQYAVILSGARIGENCNINCHTFIENDVTIGNNVTVKSGIYLWDGITIEDDVFLGPNVVFTNDLNPRSKKRAPFTKTVVKKGASIGANTSVLAGVVIGEYAMVGLGSLIVKDVPDYALVYGNPASVKGWVGTDGKKLTQVNNVEWTNSEGELFRVDNSGKLIKKL